MDEDGRPVKPVGCAMHMEGWRTRDDNRGLIDVVATQTFQYRPLVKGTKMKTPRVKADFRNLTQLAFKYTASKARGTQTAVFRDDVSYIGYNSNAVVDERGADI